MRRFLAGSEYLALAEETSERHMMCSPSVASAKSDTALVRVLTVRVLEDFQLVLWPQWLLFVVFVHVFQW